MHEILLFIHSYTRWLVVFLFVVVLVLAFRGWLGRQPWQPRDGYLGLGLIAAVDLQLLMGLFVYLVSPIIKAAFGDMGAAMKTGAIRFFVVEHLLLMLIAAGIAHTTKVLINKVKDDSTRQRRAAIGYGISFLVLLAGIPWPFFSYGRPLLRGMTG